MIPSQLIHKGLIIEAHDALAGSAAKYPGEGFSDRVENLRTEFQMMQDYFLRGVNDPHRGELYHTLRGRVANLAYDLAVRETLRENGTIKAWIRSGVSEKCDPQQVPTLLKDSNPDTLSYIFFTLIASYHWRNEDMQEWQNIILSNNLPENTPHVLVSAISLSAMQHFSKQKALLLANIYNISKDEPLRQRAFVGCIFALSMDRDPIYNKKRHEVLEVLFKREGALKELIELQIQTIMCTQATDDSNKVNDNIMPNIMKNQPFIVTKNGIEERSDKNSEEIENSIDEMERNIRKVLKMQQQGSDIFFSGFSQMKRYPFFNKTVNWFCPFSLTHPDLQSTLNAMGSSKFMDRVLEKGPFCNSDKYSFVFAMAQSMSSISDSVKEQMEEGGLGPVGMHEDISEILSPSYQRRLYLQDLYRFYSINPLAKSEKSPHAGQIFNNPFDEANDFEEWMIALEFITPSQLLEMGKYLIRKNYYDQLENLINCYPDQDCIELDFLSGELLAAQSVFGEAVEYYQSYLQEHPNHQPSMRGMAKAYYTCGDYDKASFYYDALRTLAPDKLSYVLNYSMSMVRNGKALDVLNELYRLNLEHPDDITIANTLGWALLYAEKPDKALAIYNNIPDKTLSSDVSLYLNFLYAHFVTKFRLPELKLQNPPDSSVILDEILQDESMLHIYGISDAEISIITHSI